MWIKDAVFALAAPLDLESSPTVLAEKLNNYEVLLVASFLL